MKKLVALIILISIGWQVHGQKSVFVRVFNPAGKKISNGYVIAAADTNLQIRKLGDTINIPIDSISIIKTRHSGWNYVLFGTLAGIAAANIYDAATPDSNSELGEFVDSMRGGLILFSGAALGGIASLFKNPKTFIVNKDPNGWNHFKNYISGMDKRIK